MGLSRNSVDLEIHPEETLGNSLTPFAVLGETSPPTTVPPPCPAPAHTWMVLWGIVTVRVMAYWPNPHISSYSHSKEENPHGMYMYKGWTY